MFYPKRANIRLLSVLVDFQGYNIATVSDSTGLGQPHLQKYQEASLLIALRLFSQTGLTNRTVVFIISTKSLVSCFILALVYNVEAELLLSLPNDSKQIGSDVLLGDTLSVTSQLPWFISVCDKPEGSDAFLLRVTVCNSQVGRKVK